MVSGVLLQYNMPILIYLKSLCMYILNIDGSIQPSDRDKDIRKAFRAAGFSTDPEWEVFNMLGERALGNITWV